MFKEKQILINLIYHKNGDDQSLLIDIFSASIIPNPLTTYSSFLEINIEDKIIFAKVNNQKLDHIPDLREKARQIKNKPYFMFNTHFDDD
jgi:hypothetical protein